MHNIMPVHIRAYLLGLMWAYFRHRVGVISHPTEGCCCCLR